MILFSIEEFAAKRTSDQTALEKVLAPKVKAWLTDEETNLDDLMDAIRTVFADVYESAGGTKKPAPGLFVRQVKAALKKGGEPDAHTVDRISVWLATGILNAATVQASRHDPDDIELAWVTMQDADVREAHQDAEGQTRKPNEFYDVGGHKMRYPGDPSAPIELWINCRCGLAPKKAESVAASLTAAISEKPWSGSASRFTPEQWKRSCIMHVCDGEEKSCHKLPIKEPDGALSRAGVHAAASRINQTDGPAEAKAAAKRALRGAYKTLGEDPPENIAASYSELLVEQFTGTRIDQGDEMDPEDEKTTEETEETPVVAEAVPWHGVLAPEGVLSGDGRIFAPGSLTARPLPLPLTWQKASSDGHGGSVTVARIDRMWRHEGEIRADGVMLANVEADEVIGLLAEFGKFGVSVDADNAEMEFDEENETVTFTKGRVASSSIVAIPAFAEAWVALGLWGEEDQPGEDEMLGVEEVEEEPEEALVAAAFKRGPGWITDPVATKRIHDYWTKPGEEGYIKIGWGKGGDFNRCRVLVGEKIAENSPEDLRFINNICAQWHHDALGIWPGEHLSLEDAPEREGTAAPALGMVAAGGHTAPSEWFADPEFTELTPLTITKEGRVFGHVAGWDSCHIGYGEFCVAPPHSASGYAYFMTGYVETDAGPVPTGPLTIGGGHADKRLGLRAAIAHYDDVATAACDVTVGEDEHGIWCAGWVRPGTTDDMITALRASPLSGDWRMVAGEMEMVAAHAVNVQGFGIPRVQIAARNGKQVSLVAAGMVPARKAEPEIDMDKFADAVMLRIVERQENKNRMAALAAKREKKEAGV